MEFEIEPVPSRKLGFLDISVLWLDLGIGLLVFQAGALLFPGLGMWEILLVSVAGSLVGSLLLALTGIPGTLKGIPTMVSLRPFLGDMGSYLPTVLNVIQLVGWTAFEIFIMADAAFRITGLDRFLWIIFFSAWCLLMALWGPLAVIRHYIEKFVIWIALAISIWLAYQTIPRVPGYSAQGMPLLYAMDLVVAMPISWWPLISDYNRFAKSTRGALLGTVVGYTIANSWYYFLGAAMAAATGQVLTPASIAMTYFGSAALLPLIVDETDNAWADIYSTAMSIKNIFPRASGRKLVVAATIAGGSLACLFSPETYESFLLLIGGLFVPLSGAFISDFLLKRDEKSKLRLDSLTSWALGITTYFLIINYVSWLGATIPSFLVSFTMQQVLGRLMR
ncbi:MAG: purine-cytosine permease family protein [Candidatus Methanodesulfokora sp.]|jgi:putative hydroxymethylpyrimidine transporter CytX